jgi:hypothetical protein
MTRFTRFKPGEVDHIKIISGSTHNDQVLECSVCKVQYDPRKERHRRRFAQRHWKVKHAECKKDDE